MIVWSDREDTDGRREIDYQNRGDPRPQVKSKKKRQTVQVRTRHVLVVQSLDDES